MLHSKYTSIWIRFVNGMGWYQLWCSNRTDPCQKNTEFRALHIQQICEPMIRLFIPRIGRNKFILMQDDNATAHLAKIRLEYLQAENMMHQMTTTVWNLNLTEHLWDDLKRKIKSELAVQSLAELQIH